MPAATIQEFAQVIHRNHHNARLRRRFHARLGGRLLVVLVAWLGTARAESLPDRGWPGGHRVFAATAGGPAAAFILPAATGGRRQTGTLIGAEWVERRLGGLHMVWSPGPLVLSYRHLDARAQGFNEDRYAASVVRQGGAGRASLDIAWLANDVAGGAKGFTLGTSLRYQLAQGLRLAGRFEHLNTPAYLDGKLCRSTTIGVAWVAGSSLALACDALFRDDGADNFGIRYGFESQLAKHLHVAASLDNEQSFRLGLSVTEDAEEATYGVVADRRGNHRHVVQLSHEIAHNPPPPRFPAPVKR